MLACVFMPSSLDAVFIWILQAWECKAGTTFLSPLGLSQHRAPLMFTQLFTFSFLKFTYLWCSFDGEAVPRTRQLVVKLC